MNIAVIPACWHRNIVRAAEIGTLVCIQEMLDRNSVQTELLSNLTLLLSGSCEITASVIVPCDGCTFSGPLRL